MFKHSKGLYILILVSLLINGAYAGETKSKIARKSGEAHAVFLTLLKDVVEKLDNGVGRVSMEGSAGFGKSCKADFFISAETTYIVLATSDNNLFDEFYVDHPKQSFSNILFQSFIKNGKKETLRIDEKNGGGYSITRKGDKLSIIRMKDKNEFPECRFSLSDAKVFPGETE